MAKKTKSSKSENLVNSILEDLQHDDLQHDDPHAEGSRRDEIEVPIHAANLNSEEKTIFGSSLVSEETRRFPKGLEAQVISPHSKKKRSLEPSSPFDLLGVESDEAESDHKSVSDSGRLSLEQESSSSPLSLNQDSSEATAHLSENSMTRKLADEGSAVTHPTGITDRTQPMIRSTGSFAPSDVATKVSHGYSRPLTKSSASLAASVTEAQMMQAEHLRMAQTRILELEKEVELLRQENELLASAGEIAKARAEELSDKIHEIERNRVDALDQAKMEMNIYRENLVEKDRELGRMRHKIDDLQTRLAKDLKKIRVRERELENRLELTKMEKTALIRAKDDAILDLKNKVDHLHSELESYKQRCSELGQKVDGQHDQLSRTVRALRLALTNLEANDSGGTVTPLKKAE